MSNKLDMWERKLLDLGLRNNLLNMRLSKSTIPIMVGELDELEDSLSDGKEFIIIHKEASDFSSNKLRSTLSEKELETAIKELYRNARTSLEENGANTLYIALGILEWYETPQSTTPRLAPILLEPIEIVRKSAAKGYAIRLRDDDIQINITLLEKLKQDFEIVIEGLDPLPLDYKGVDTKTVMNTIREAVSHKSEWKVIPSTYLGIFSFTQFVMWNDLKNRTDDLEKNKIVKSLIDGKLCFDAEDMCIGEKVVAEDVLLPLPADASQLYAIDAAAKGQSFVLHGPPGTGKSQTITTLIANALAQNKTILFVAEKMAALNVVQSRLEKIGIGPFCLELHSNKAKKKDVLEKLRRATEITKTTSPEGFKKQAAQIKKTMEALDSYTTALHEKQSFGYSAYELINIYEANPTEHDLPAISKDYLDTLDQEKLELGKELVSKLTAAGKAVGHPNNILNLIGASEYTQQLKAQVLEAIPPYREALLDFKEESSALSELLSFSYSSYADIETTAAIAKDMIFWSKVPTWWAKDEDLSSDLQKIKSLCQRFINASNIKVQLLTQWNEDFLSQDPDELMKTYEKIEKQWAVPKFFSMNSFMKRLTKLSKAKVDSTAIKSQIYLLGDYQAELNAAREQYEPYSKALSELLVDDETNWRDIFILLDEAKASSESLHILTGSDHFRMTYCSDKEAIAKASRFLDSFNSLLDKKAEFDKVLFSRNTASKDWLGTQLNFCDELENNIDDLREWVIYSGISNECIELGLANIVDIYNSGLPSDEVMTVFKASLSRTLLQNIIASNEALNRFSGGMFEEKIDSFKRLSQTYEKLTRQEIYSRLASNIPNFAQAASQSSELGILQKAIRSNGRGISIRRLFDQLPNLLPRLCPCMLMSPLSAAQYLDPKRAPFDIVVFDEASQLSTCKAVGALARGRDAIIVGDPNQMPPTSFFGANTFDEDNLADEDLESILDDCLALGIPQTHLLWHYRSKHESLIAFSNNQFYENKLYTFPSVNDRERKVKLIHVDGCFDRGRTRQNPAEAQAIVDEIIRRFNDPELSKYSYGIVTFNIMQQNLIEDLIGEACAKNPQLDNWLYSSEEPIFIKNLENVQGDERDVILFSVGYGPDSDGKVTMNFGPLNRDGGWRRLNVAVSRSRYEMLVFAGLSPDHIDLDKTSAEGVRALKAFLEYASGKDVLTPPALDNTETHSGIVSSICAYLNSLGYEAVTDIGHSDYKVDIGVIDPNCSERYLLGILLDGPYYKSSKTTNDRELSQISMLHSLGWNTMRVWSMDWWDNKNKILKKIKLRLEQLVCSPSPITMEAQPDESDEEDLIEDSTPISPLTPLVYYATKAAQAPMTADEFITVSNTNSIKARINEILKNEAPICEELLIKRILQIYGISRAGARIHEKLTATIASMKLKSDVENGSIIYWNKTLSPDSYYMFRACGSDSSKRDIREVPQIEIVNALFTILYNQISLPGEDLVKEASKALGYPRMGSQVILVINSACEYIRQNGYTAIDQLGKWHLTTKGKEYARNITYCS